MSALSCASTIALQLEKVSAMLPTMFPCKMVTVVVRYRYAWETKWREKKGLEFALVSYNEMYFSEFGNPYPKEALRAAKHRLRRWHWTDRAGRVRRVKEVFVKITAMRDEPPLAKQGMKAFRLPLRLES